MTEPEPDHLAALRDLAEDVAGSSHDELAAETVETVTDFVAEVDEDLDEGSRLAGARKLLAFWETFVHTKLTDEMAVGTIAEDSIERFEQAFDEEVIGIDLYQALETLAIVADMEGGETDEERLRQWAERVHALTEEYASHLESHQR